MGGAFIGGADDATAASWNPAGLVFLEKPEASATYVYSSVYQSIDNESVEDLGLNHGYLNFVSAAIPLSIGQRNVVGCIAYQRVIDLFDKQEGYDDNGYYTLNQKGGVDAISPSLGIQIASQFSLGLALNLYIGSTITKWDSTELGEKYEAPNEKYSGSNLTMGGMFDFGKFRIGAVYKSPFNLKAERDSDNDFESYEYEWKMPTMFGFGLMFEPTPNLRLAADYELRKFSDFEIRLAKDQDFVNLEWLDVNQLRLGAEFLLMSGNSIIPLRLGLKTEPKPYEDANGDQVSGAALTMGIGLASETFSLGATLEYSALTLKFGDQSFETEVTTSQLNFILSGIFYFGK
jgi:long-subunit fatty acid transport protein